MRHFVSAAVLAAAIVSSIATSPPQWSVVDRERVTERTERGDGLAFDLAVSATPEALPEVEGGVSPQGGSSDEGLQTVLTVDLALRSQGVLGGGREDTDVHAELWMETPEGDWLVDELDAFVGGDDGEPVLAELRADGVFAMCAPLTSCDADLSVVITQTGDARLKVGLDARVMVFAPLYGSAPDEAAVFVEVARRH